MGYTIPEEYRPKTYSGALPGGAATAQWFGTAAFRMKYKDTTLLVDPNVTRPGIFRIAFLKLYVNEALCRETFPEADHILVGHSHCDHLMDAPAIARDTGAVVHGSASTAAVCRGAGLDEKQIHEFTPREPFACGAFRVTFIPSEHGRALFGRVPFPGEIDGTPKPPLKTKDYKSGPTSMMLIEAGSLRMLHAGSAALIDHELAAIGPVHTLFLGLAGRKGTPDFLCRITGPLQPRVIIGHHFDNFFLPLRKGMKFNQGVNLPGFIEDAKQACPDARIILPAFFDTIAFDADSGELLD